MAKKGVTDEEVKRAVEQLIARGVKPTAEGIREEIGYGSMTTIVPKWKRLREEQASASPDSLRVLPAALHLAACAFVDEEVKKAKQLYVDDLAQAHLDVAGLAETNDRLRCKNEEKVALIQELESRCLRLQGCLDQAEKGLADLRDEVKAERSAANEVRAELAALKVRLERHEQVEREAVGLRDALTVARQAQMQAEHRAEILAIENKYAKKQAGNAPANEHPDERASMAQDVDNGKAKRRETKTKGTAGLPPRIVEPNDDTSASQQASGEETDRQIPLLPVGDPPVAPTSSDVSSMASTVPPVADGPPASSTVMES